MQFFSYVLHVIKVVVLTCVTQATVTQIALTNSGNPSLKINRQSLTSESRASFSLTGESQPSATIPEPLSSTVILEPSLTTENEEKSKSKLLCPLCRGEVNGWVVVDAARIFMNTKSRSCASETCDFSGRYRDLRKHARTVHPFVRPSEADPERPQDWRNMESRRNLGDLLSTLQSSIGEERDGDSTSVSSFVGGGLLTAFFLVFHPENSLRSSSRSGTSRATVQVMVRSSRGRTHLWGESYDGESRDDENEFSDGGSGLSSHDLFQLWRRRSTPDNDEY